MMTLRVLGLVACNLLVKQFFCRSTCYHKVSFVPQRRWTVNLSLASWGTAESFAFEGLDGYPISNLLAFPSVMVIEDALKVANNVYQYLSRNGLQGSISSRRQQSRGAASAGRSEYYCTISTVSSRIAGRDAR
jgi:hypothetical protein